MSGSHEKRNLIIAGLIIGAIAGFLVLAGNPGNMGFCIACFVRDTVGGLGLHRAAPVQYIRPEIIGLILGAYVLSMIRGEHQSKGGSSPIIRFILGFFVMIGALMFLGCPIRMILRLGGGDLNALFGIAGFAGGIGFGTIFLKRGYSLQRIYALSKLESAMMPAIQVGLLVLVVTAPAFIFFSQKGPGAMHAPWLISLAAGLVVGGLSQFSRLCTVGGFRDLFLFKKSILIFGYLAVLIGVFVVNISFGNFHLGFENQPIAHTDGLWNFLGMALAGFCSVLLGGCPLRQLIMTGEGNSDSAVTVLGLAAGAAFAHNFGLAASGAGPTLNGQIAVAVGFIVALIIAILNTKRANA